ncbi:MAG: ring-cleaving dioxygenase [Chloroflexi bacterium]|nr:MAG: ring-cleaving dioxygenase [Chloroflexota bacterium]MBL1196163.1 ring-cleaving dioxygenase [Chloroflexota bacterium]NOH13456.1 ring-cleaving dioxygenase [Chloroflexota bacterium]
MNLTGIHHVTAASAKIADNLDFYTNVLGMRLVKKSVNQDDVSAYHLYYADKLGTPGTDMTFFDWPHIGPKRPGTNSIVGTAFSVSSSAAFDFWTTRLEEKGAKNIERLDFAGRQMLSFEDPEGQQLYLVDDGAAPFDGEIWARPDIPDEHALRGFYSVLLSMPAFDQLDPILTQILNFVELERSIWVDGQSEAIIYATTMSGGPGTEVWLLQQPDAPIGHLGAGGVHHVAFRVSDMETQQGWQARISQSGLQVTEMIDRFWFKSIYFRVSGGILFEIATDGPGFAIDEPLEALGKKLVLPPFLESQREQIEAGLTPIGE